MPLQFGSSRSRSPLWNHFERAFCSVILCCLFRTLFFSRLVVGFGAFCRLPLLRPGLFEGDPFFPSGKSKIWGIPFKRGESLLG